MTFYPVNLIGGVFLSPVSVANGGTGATTTAGLQDAAGLYGWLPADVSLIAWNFDPMMANANTSLINGTIYLQQIVLRAAQTITKGAFYISTGAGTATASQNFLALVDSTGAIKASTSAGAIDTATQSAGWLSQAFSSSFAAPAGRYWLAVLTNALTPLKVGGITIQSSAGAEAGIATAANFRFAVNGTTATALPGSFTMASNVHTNAQVFAVAVG